ncbi:MAG: hypothetical protein B7Z81_15905 [Acidocella sp. 20-61-6]|nr:MAG: hypothetical protein B7Z81_15905 [Acidocella sp. 20-61-6]
MSEILGVLFKFMLALLGIAGVVVLLYEAMSGSSVGTEIANLTTLQGNLAQLYTGSTTTTGTSSISDAVAVSADAAPSSMVSGNNLVNQWNKAVTVSGDAQGDIIIAETGLPRGACAKMVTAVPSYNSVSINGTSLTAPVDPGTATSACQAGDNNTLTFTFGRT